MDWPSKFTIHCETREDGGLRVWSDDLPGLVLSHSDYEMGPPRCDPGPSWSMARADHAAPGGTAQGVMTRDGIKPGLVGRRS